MTKAANKTVAIPHGKWTYLVTVESERYRPYSILVTSAKKLTFEDVAKKFTSDGVTKVEHIPGCIGVRMLGVVEARDDPRKNKRH